MSRIIRIGEHLFTSDLTNVMSLNKTDPQMNSWWCIGQKQPLYLIMTGRFNVVHLFWFCIIQLVISVSVVVLFTPSVSLFKFMKGKVERDVHGFGNILFIGINL